MILILLITLIDLAKSINYCMKYLPYCECRSSERLECSNFEKFSKLNFRDPVKIKLSNLKQYYLMKLNPKVPLKLDESLNLSELNLDINKFQFILNNINSFELTSNPFHIYKLLGSLPIISINNSSFSFVYRGKEFDWLCDLVIKDSQLYPIFSSFRSVYLGYSSSINFSSPICPAVFKNANLDSLFMTHLSLSNRPRFIAVQDSDANINSHINSLHIQSSQISLDKYLLEKHVFKYTQKISIEFSNLTAIDKDVFKQLKSLKHINFWLFNFEHLIYSIGLDWLNSLNYELKLFYDSQVLDKKFQKLNDFVHRKQVTIEFRDESGTYLYPDTDFCKFKDFPHSRLVFPIIQSSKKLNCTCTIIWLLQFYKYSNKDMRTATVELCFNGVTIFELLVIGCRFSERLQNCSALAKSNFLNGTIQRLSIADTIFNPFKSLRLFFIIFFIRYLF